MLMPGVFPALRFPALQFNLYFMPAPVGNQARFHNLSPQDNQANGTYNGTEYEGSHGRDGKSEFAHDVLSLLDGCCSFYEAGTLLNALVNFTESSLCAGWHYISNPLKFLLII